MGKNGKFFITIVETNALVPSVWDPYAYRHIAETEKLGKFVRIQKVTTGNFPHRATPFAAIEYRHFPGEHYLSFTLQPAAIPCEDKHPSVGEGQLLFGTMRAYLGNIVVTPRAEWIAQPSPVYFSIKSEFVAITPHDELPYFWWFYLRSQSFLENLPVGAGGTRPRLQTKPLEQIPVAVPAIEIRAQIHQQLCALARQEWLHYTALMTTLETVTSMLEETD